MALSTATKTVAAAGTAERIRGAETWVSAYIIRAMEDNTGNVYLGGSGVSNTAPDMQPGESIVWSSRKSERENLRDIYVDADVSAEGVDIWYVPA